MSKRPLIIVAGLAAVAALWGWRLPFITDPAWWEDYRLRALGLNLAVTFLVLAAVYVAAGTGTRRHRVFRVILLGGSVGLTLAVLEVPALLGYDYRKPLGVARVEAWWEQAFDANREDPELVHIHHPDVRHRGQLEGCLVQFGIPRRKLYDVDVYFDQNGFRNPKGMKQADAVFLGDSFVEAPIIPSEKTLVSLVGQRTGRTVANLGQSGYGPQQALLVLERYGLPLAPKLVVWCFYGGNDLRDIDKYADGLDKLKERPVAALRFRSLSMSLLRVATRAITRDLTEPLPKAKNMSGIFTERDGKKSRRYFSQVDGPVEPRQWSVVTETLSEGRRLAEAAGARLLVAYLPCAFRVYRGHVEIEPGTVAATWRPNELPSALRDFCEKSGIGFADTTPALRDSVARGVHPYFDDDIHFNVEGHAIAARVISRYIERAGL